MDLLNGLISMMVIAAIGYVTIRAIFAGAMTIFYFIVGLIAIALLFGGIRSCQTPMIIVIQGGPP
jgi:hypothetical protein